MEPVKAEPKAVILNPVTEGTYPTKNRKVTDLICMLVFVLFWVLSIYAAIHGLSLGNPKNLAVPYDSSGNRCDWQATRGYPYLFFNGTAGDHNQTVCVADCPTATVGIVPCYPNKLFKSCTQIQPYPSYLLAKRFCVSTQPEVSERSRKFINGISSDAYITDIVDSWYVLFLAIFISVVLGYAYVTMLEKCAGVIISILISLFFVGITLLGFLFLSNYLSLKHQDPLPKRAKISLTLAIVTWSGGLILLLCILCLWSKFRIAINVVETAADFITDYPKIITVPVIMLFGLIIYVIYWIVVAVYIFSVGDVDYVEGRSYGLVEWSVFTRFFWYVHCFALFWNASFILAISIFVITTGACIWYFAPDRKKLESPIARGFTWGLVYHVGTLAMGSLLVAIAWFLQMIFSYLYQKLNARAKTAHTGTGCLLKCAICVVTVYEKFIKFINRHAYIETVLKSDSFCTAASNATALIVKNAMKFGILHGLAQMVIIFGNLAIAILTTIASYYLIQFAEIVSDGVFETNAPLILCFIIGFIIAALFGHVFDVSADAIVHCYLIDIDSQPSAKAKHSFPNIEAAMEKGALKQSKQLRIAETAAVKELATLDDKNHKDNEPLLMDNDPKMVERK